MKKVLLVLAIVLSIMPITAFADMKEIKKEDYVSINFKEALTEEGIELEYSDYKESDDQITIYLFRGKGCAYCKKFLTFLNNIASEYGKYFKVESYEVWYDAKNAKLFDQISEFLDEPAGGVPYIIIGDEVFPGYAEQYDERIKKAIVDLYQEEERYDVFIEMDKVYKEQNKVDYKPTIVTILSNFVIVSVSSCLVLGYIHNKDKKLNAKIDELQACLKSTEKEEKKELKTASTSKTKTKKETTSKTKTNTKKKNDSK